MLFVVVSLCRVILLSYVCMATFIATIANMGTFIATIANIGIVIWTDCLRLFIVVYKLILFMMCC